MLPRLSTFFYKRQSIVNQPKNAGPQSTNNVGKQQHQDSSFDNGGNSGTNPFLFTFNNKFTSFRRPMGSAHNNVSQAEMDIRVCAFLTTHP